MGPISKILAEETSALYRKPSGFAVDRQQHKNSSMEFHVKLGVLEGLPPAIRQAARCLKAVKPIRLIKLDLYEENIKFMVETGANGTRGDQFCFPGAEGKALRIFRDPKAGDIWLSFQIKTQADKSNYAFISGKFGEEVRLTAEGEPELPGTDVEEPKQKDLEFEEVAAQPKKSKKAKKAAKVPKPKAAKKTSKSKRKKK